MMKFVKMFIGVAIVSLIGVCVLSCSNTTPTEKPDMTKQQSAISIHVAGMLRVSGSI